MMIGSSSPEQVNLRFNADFHGPVEVGLGI
jgi:hypothetical protein